MIAVFSPLLQTFAANCSKPTFLGLQPWYQYLPYGPDKYGQGTCVINLDPNGLLGAHSSLLLIGLAVIDDLLRVAALVAVGYVIYGGIQYITSGGSPDTTKRAQSTIINALIGLVLAILAASIVAFIGNQLGS